MQSCFILLAASSLFCRLIRCHILFTSYFTSEVEVFYFFYQTVVEFNIWLSCLCFPIRWNLYLARDYFHVVTLQNYGHLCRNRPTYPILRHFLLVQLYHPRTWEPQFSHLRKLISAAAIMYVLILVCVCLCLHTRACILV